jgi:hypothetical protein
MKPCLPLLTRSGRCPATPGPMCPRREIVFDSNRTGTLGGQDLYSATRENIDDPWSTRVNLGNVVNTAANETRGSFWRGETLYFGRSPGPEGSTDIYVTIRGRHGGH